MPRSVGRLQLAGLPDAAVGGREPDPPQPVLPQPPSLPLTLAALGVVAVGTLLPATPLAATLGFQPLPGAFFAALAGMVVAYLALIETGSGTSTGPPPPRPLRLPGRGGTAGITSCAAGPPV